LLNEFNNLCHKILSGSPVDHEKIVNSEEIWYELFRKKTKTENCRANRILRRVSLRRRVHPETAVHFFLYCSGWNTGYAEGMSEGCDNGDDCPESYR